MIHKASRSFLVANSGHREPVRPLAIDKAHRADLYQSHEAAGKDDKRHRKVV